MRYLLVDRIIALDPGNNITGVKNVAMSEDFLEFHFPKNPIMPGIMLLEALVQLSGWLEAASSDFREMVSGFQGVEMQFLRLRSSRRPGGTERERWSRAFA